MYSINEKGFGGCSFSVLSSQLILLSTPGTAKPEMDNFYFLLILSQFLTPFLLTPCPHLANPALSWAALFGINVPYPLLSISNIWVISGWVPPLSVHFPHTIIAQTGTRQNRNQELRAALEISVLGLKSNKLQAQYILFPLDGAKKPYSDLKTLQVLLAVL